MFDLDKFLAKTNRRLLADPRSLRPEEPKQQRMMVIALTLLLFALAFALYRDRDFWFPGTQEAAEQAQDQPQVQPAPPVVAIPDSPIHKKSHGAKAKPKAPPAETPPDTSAPPVTATRTVLPPLEVEVVAGNVLRTLRPGTNSVHVEVQPGSPSTSVADAPAANDAADTAGSVTTEAAEHVQISSDTAQIVSQPVKPSYPLLARQMKVQGSVILQAMISRNGSIQDLRVLSGPPILASAAQEAVKQWHFKPHLQGTEPVETQTRITVNFTISTN